MIIHVAPEPAKLPEWAAIMASVGPVTFQMHCTMDLPGKNCSLPQREIVMGAAAHRPHWLSYPHIPTARFRPSANDVRRRPRDAVLRQRHGAGNEQQFAQHDWQSRSITKVRRLDDTRLRPQPPAQCPRLQQRRPAPTAPASVPPPPPPASATANRPLAVNVRWLLLSCPGCGSACSVRPNPLPSFDPSSSRAALIATAAYYRAQKRDFQPGCEVEDWLAAEREIDGTGTDPI